MTAPSRNLVFVVDKDIYVRRLVQPFLGDTYEIVSFDDGLRRARPRAAGSSGRLGHGGHDGAPRRAVPLPLAEGGSCHDARSHLGDEHPRCRWAGERLRSGRLLPETAREGAFPRVPEQPRGLDKTARRALVSGARTKMSLERRISTGNPQADEILGGVSRKTRSIS